MHIFVEPFVPGRAYTNRPDDRTGYQYWFAYALETTWDEDRQLDLDGSIANAAAIVNRWLKEKSGAGMRLDTYQGEPDVIFLRLMGCVDSDSCSTAIAEALRRQGLIGDEILTEVALAAMKRRLVVAMPGCTFLLPGRSHLGWYWQGISIDNMCPQNGREWPSSPDPPPSQDPDSTGETRVEVQVRDHLLGIMIHEIVHAMTGHTGVPGDLMETSAPGEFWDPGDIYGDQWIADLYAE